VTVAVIVFATQSLLRGNARETAKTIEGKLVFGIRRQIKIVGFGTAGLFTAVLIGFHKEFFDRRSFGLISIPFFFILLGVWLANGSVIVSEDEITKKTLWSVRSLRWEEISGIRFYEKQKYIELRGEDRKLVIDVRFVALQQLLDEVLRHSKVQVERT
jgi:hypothetical protein